MRHSNFDYKLNSLLSDAVALRQGCRKAFRSEGAEGQSPVGGFGGMLPRKILRFDMVRDRI